VLKECLAYWGYTASTGSLNNQHTVCPLNVEYTPALVSYEEITICADETYNGWTESGFYIREENDNNGCIHQLEIQGDPTLRCNRDSIWLTVNFDINYPIADVDYFWSIPGGTSSQSDSILATLPGLYTVNTFINYEDVLCQVGDEFEIQLDTVAPILDPIDDLTILCNTPATERIIVAPFGADSLSFDWYYEDILVGTGDTLNVSSEGEYTLVGTDTINGCVDTTVASVMIDGDIPQITLQDDTLTLNCQFDEYLIDAAVTYQAPGTLSWDLDGNGSSADTSIVVNSPGLYTLSIVDANGCNTQDSVRVLIDTIAPLTMMQDIIIPCDETLITTDPVTINENVNVVWSGPIDVLGIPNPTFTIAGAYYVEVTDTINFCTTYDTLLVDVLGASPEINLAGDTVLDCNNNAQSLSSNIDQTDAIINWYDSENNLLSSTDDFTATG